jgi:signal transduction histidine kinase
MSDSDFPPPRRLESASAPEQRMRESGAELAEELSRSEAHVRALLAAAERQAQERDLLDLVRVALAREADLPGVFRTVVEAIAATFGYTQVSIYRLEDDTTLVMQHQVGYNRVLERIPIERGVSGRVARTAQPVLVEDVRSEPAFLGAIEGIASEVCVPFFDEGQVAGTLNVESTGGVRLGEADLRLMLAVSEHLSLAVGRARLYAEVRRTAERLQLALAASGMATWDWDVRSGSVRWSDEMGPLYGLPAGTPGVDAATYFSLVHPEDHELIRAEDRTALSRSDAYEVDFRVVLPDGTVRWLAGRGRVVERDPGGEARRIVGVTMDVSARHQAESERLRLAEAEAALRARDEILSIAAHELRTPVTTVMGFADLAIRGLEAGREPGPWLGRALDRIANGSRQLAALIEDLLDVSRLRLGRLDLRLETLDLAELSRDVIDRYRERADEADVSMTFVAPAEPCLVQADRHRLDQVLTNLLDNSLKYSPDGGEVRVKVAAVDGGALMVVRDAGIGLPAGAAEAIFAPFGRAPNAVELNLPGLGLGLHICRGIVERHGGRIWAESAGDGRGTIVSLWLPTRVPAPDDGQDR